MSSSLPQSPIPQEYVDGYTEFLGVRIDLSKRPLIPRPETEYWTEQAIRQIRSRQLQGSTLKLQVLDLFTGSGCIGIAVAKHCPNVEVTLADKTDYITTPLPSKCKFIQSDLFSNLPGKFDFILANPPYVPDGTGVPGIMDHEPSEALYAGPEGLDVINPFLAQAPAHLNPGGQIWLEIDPPQKPSIQALLNVLHPVLNKLEWHEDQYGRIRWVVLKT